MIGRAPAFWERGHGGVPARLLAPVGAIVGALVHRLDHARGWRSPVAVFCCGNATVGGTGKTIVALDLLARLARAGIDAHALTRGHGGRLGRSGTPERVDPTRHTATAVGDEALLLARAAPTWVCRDRAAAARAAIAAGAGALVMDDGLQHRGLAKDCTLLVIDGESGFGNGRVMPAGPLRERPLDAVRRSQAVVLIGEDRAGAAARFAGERPTLRASLVPDPGLHNLSGGRVLAFAGIGRPAKFFDMIEAAGPELLIRAAFPDHHRFRPTELARLADRARAERAMLVTTEKDAVRLPPAFRAGVTVFGVGLAWHDGRIDRLLRRAIEDRSP